MVSFRRSVLARTCTAALACILSQVTSVSKLLHSYFSLLILYMAISARTDQTRETYRASGEETVCIWHRLSTTFAHLQGMYMAKTHKFAHKAALQIHTWAEMKPQSKLSSERPWSSRYRPLSLLELPCAISCCISRAVHHVMITCLDVCICCTYIA